MKKLLLVSLCFLLLCVTQTFAQNRTVTGTVTSKDDGLPLPGVSVTVSGTTIGTQTNAAGKFSISVPANAKSLRFSFIGFESQDASIGTRTDVSVSLSSSSNQLNEVVVAAAGLQVQKSTQGYATTQLKSQAITQGKTPSVAAALSGKVAGLQVNVVSSGVNPNVRIVLRGNRSLLGNNQALIVLDNIIVPNAVLNSLNPEDIEDIQVLNGASGAALYGSDASNGAILITTKKGKKGSTSIRFSNTTSLEQVSYFPKVQNQFGSGSASGIQQYTPYENQQYGPAFDGSLKPVGRVLEDGSQQILPYAATNSKNDFWETGVANQSDFTLQTGDDKSTTYFSGQYFTQKGTTPGDRYNRVSLRLNGTRDIGSNVSLDYSANYVQNRLDVTSATGTIYDNLLNQPDNIRITDYKDWRNNKFANPNGFYNDYYDNPYYRAANSRAKTRQDYLIGKAELKWRPIDVLTFVGRVGISTYNTSYKSTVNKFVFTPYTIASGKFNGANNIPGSVEDGSSYTTQLLSEFQGTFEKTYGDFKVSFTAGTQLRGNNDNSQTINASGLIQEDLFNVGARYTANTGGGQSSATRRQMGVYGDLRVTYKDYLTLEGTGRNDWTSVLARDNRSFFYPSLSASFVPTMAFESLKDNDMVNSLKIRASLSKVGQANIDAYANVPTYSQAAGYPFSTGPGYILSSRLVSSSLRPEITKGWEAGFDGLFFNERVSASLTYYKTNTTNQTVPTGVSNATGFTSYLTNTGNVLNKGLESTLSVIAYKNTDWQLTLGGNYTYQINKVVEISSDLNQVALSTGASAQVYAITGLPYPVLQGTDYLRDDQGRVVINRATGYPIANAAQTILGNTSPKHRVGVNMEVKYKSFRLFALAEYRGGFVVYNSGAGTYDFSGSGIRTAYYNRERFVFPNSSYFDEATNSYVPNTNITVSDGGAGFFADNNYNMNIATNYIYSGASWKLREVSLSYDLPKSILGNQKYVKGVTISAQGRNLFLWVPKSNLYTDPEFNFTDGNAIGIQSLSQTPPTRYFGATLSVTL
ncbi:SusC/RagA family TonB-linked outer membrane protein [Mucilaginibacter roseus]|uniref:SusC/RagA family TonB-linked outer membrane protein n=1 Tax=Mucilaginibacter roseus TaxID=1528868 RepID=A0ABS8U336_9SPHI|nr:SusC/RagA family TonB-linked outer membrane protein [Mucilaginibacter roseus]MCD8741529.1 SusC/RagA family TonB-linked outer membrane protein [Mucilaginibacter roseus]